MGTDFLAGVGGGMHGGEGGRLYPGNPQVAMVGGMSVWDRKAMAAAELSLGSSRRLQGSIQRFSLCETHRGTSKSLRLP